MKEVHRVSLLVLGFAVLGIPGLLFAATGHVKFEVVGQPTCTKEIASGATTLAIGQQCTTQNAIITISTSSLDIAGLNDGSADAWRMPAAVNITANQAISHLHLVFLREATQNPTAGYYKTWIKGGVANGTGSISVIGSVKRLSDGVTLTLDPVNGSGPTFQASSVKQWTNGQLSGNRELKIDLDIVSLTSGAKLDLALGGGGYIKLQSQANPDNGATCHDASNWLITTACVFNRSVLDAPTATEEQLADAYEFAQYNWENLSQDMARGQGEHLASLATLLNVPAEQQPAFFELAQGTYRTSTGVETPKQVAASLHKTWSSR